MSSCTIADRHFLGDGPLAQLRTALKVSHPSEHGVAGPRKRDGGRQTDAPELVPVTSAIAMVFLLSRIKIAHVTERCNA